VSTRKIDVMRQKPLIPMTKGDYSMRSRFSGLMVIIGLSLSAVLNLSAADHPAANPSADGATVGMARKTGNIASNLLVECSGIDVSMIRDDLLWAINDSGDGPYLYALGIDGRDRGRVGITKAVNRDWEDLATFQWQGRAMILVADTGDNRERYGTYRFYIVEEPRLAGERFDPSAVADLAWTVAFSYPDHGHDAEAVTVDPTGGQILVLTKRDTPPLLFSLPLKPAAMDDPLVARRIAIIAQIPPPTTNDLLYPYGRFRSQPTAMDLTPDGLKMVVLTYKHAYVFNRAAGDAWEAITSVSPVMIPLPLAQNTHGFGQREAACFSQDAERLLVTSEGQHAAIYQFKADSRR
jgi:hypothetical protein